MKDAKRKDKKLSITVEGLTLARDHFSGIGHYTLGICRGLEKIAEKDPFISLKVTTPFRMVENLKRHGLSEFKIVRLPILNRIVAKLLDKGIMPPIDIFTGKSMFFFPDAVLFPALFSKRVVVVHDLSFEVVPQFVDSGNSKFLSKNVAKSVKKADKIVAVSEFTRSSVIEHYKVDPKNVVTIPNGVDRKTFYKRSKEEVDFVKAKYGISGNYIMFLGNLEPRKNLSSLVKAYINLPEKIRSGYSLLLVGANAWLTGDLFKDIQKARMMGLSIIRPDKYVSDQDVPALYSGAACFVYPSHFEGFGVPIIEAMACGTPVITSNNSSMPEVAGGAAELVDSKSVLSISKGIEKVMSNRKKQDKMIKDGLERVDAYSWEDSAEKLVRLYREIN